MRNNFLKRVLGITVVTVLSVSFLAGCGAAEEKNEQVDVVSSEPAANSEEVSEEEISETVSTEKEDEVLGEVRLLAADAEVSGQGYDYQGNVTDSCYDESTGVIGSIGDNTKVTFKVPEGIDGVYDLYLELGKSPYAAGTTYLGITAGDGKEYVPILDIQGCNETYSDLNELGLLAVEKNVEVKTGDNITVLYKPGYTMEWGGVMSCALPSMGNLYLYTADTPVAVGYGEEKAVREVKKETVDETDILSGKTIVWLGSSVTFGDNGYSMAEAIDDKHSALNTYKYAISGTMLTNVSDSSYVARMKEIDPNMEIDLFVVQLSTNDATNGQPLGDVSDSTAIGDFDDTTVTGAMEEIIAYVKETWKCPIVFYTGTYYESDEYQAMVDRTHELKDKWGIELVDLWNNENLKSMCTSGEISSYMKIKYGTEEEMDPIHPNATGYQELWAPEFEKVFYEVLTK